MRMKAAPAQCYRNLRVDLTDHPVALDRKHRLDKIDERRATPWPSYLRRQLNGCGERANGPPAPRSGASTPTNSPSSRSTPAFKATSTTTTDIASVSASTCSQRAL